MPLSAAAMVDVNFDSLTVATSSVMESSAMLLAETEPWVQPLALVMGPTLNFLSFAMVRYKRYDRVDDVAPYIFSSFFQLFETDEFYRFFLKF